MSYLSESIGCISNDIIADTLVIKHSAFNSFQEMVNAKGSYRPSMDMRDVELLWLANYYDDFQEGRGDDRRAYRYATTTPEAEAAAAELKRIRIEVRLDEPEAPAAVTAPAKRTTLRGPGGLRLVLDPNDQDTPAMVFSAFMKHSASYYCAVETCELTGCGAVDEEFNLNNEQEQWLDQQVALVEATYTAARPEGWDC